MDGFTPVLLGRIPGGLLVAGYPHHSQPLSAFQTPGHIVSSSTVQHFDPNSEQAETVLYPCGTVAIGQFEPCSHSSVQVLCCSCAGCAADVWSCGREFPRPHWEHYEAPSLAGYFGINVVLWMFALVVLVLSCTEIPVWIICITWFLVSLAVTMILVGAGLVISVIGSLLGL